VLEDTTSFLKLVHGVELAPVLNIAYETA